LVALALSGAIVGAVAIAWGGRSRVIGVVGESLTKRYEAQSPTF
jgi:hypothetical protein